MATRVVLHVGLPKTGTTYLQSVLWHNRARLAAQGLLYPGDRPRHHLWASMVVREHPRVDQRSPRAARAWDDLVEQINAWPGTALVSHEFFGIASPQQASAAVERLEGAEIEVVVTARDVLTITASYWQEFVKHGFAGLALDEFPREAEPWDEWGRASVDLETVLRNWSVTTSPDRVHVLVLPPPGSPRTALLDAYAAILGIDVDGFTFERARANESLGLVEVELLRRIAGRLDGFSSPLDRGVWIRSYLAHDTLAQLPGRSVRFLPSPARIEELRVMADRSIEHVRTSGYTVHGDLELLRVPERPPSVRHPATVTDAELLESSVETIARLLGDLRTFRRENTAFRRREAQLEQLRAAEEARGGPWRRLGRRIRHGPAALLTWLRRGGGV